EPQDHPNVIAYPGAPPTRPYDNAGWTLAFQMGVQFDRILEGFTGPFEKVTDWNVAVPSPVVTSGQSARCPRTANDCFTFVNRTLKAGKGPVSATAETFSVGSGASGVSIARAPRIALWDQYGGSAESGWTRWILEQFEFPFTRVYPQELDA